MLSQRGNVSATLVEGRWRLEVETNAAGVVQRAALLASGAQLNLRVGLFWRETEKRLKKVASLFEVKEAGPPEMGAERVLIDKSKASKPLPR